MNKAQELLYGLTYDERNALGIIFEKEQWAIIPDTDDKYLVSTDGRILSLKVKGKALIMSPGTNKQTGYQNLPITLASGRSISKSVHRLVAEAFVDGRSDKRNQVDHVNRIRTDNAARNLRWVSPSENAANKGKDKQTAQTKYTYDDTPLPLKHGNSTVYKLTNPSLGWESLEAGMENVQYITGQWSNAIHKAARTGEPTVNGWRIEKLGKVADVYAKERAEMMY